MVTVGVIMMFILVFLVWKGLSTIKLENVINLSRLTGKYLSYLKELVSQYDPISTLDTSKPFLINITLLVNFLCLVACHPISHLCCEEL